MRFQSHKLDGMEIVTKQGDLHSNKGFFERIIYSYYNVHLVKKKNIIKKKGYVLY